MVMMPREGHGILLYTGATTLFINKFFALKATNFLDNLKQPIYIYHN